MSAALDAVRAHLDADHANARERCCDLLRIPSVSTDPAYMGEMDRAAAWLRDQLAGMGFTAAVHPTDGHLVVLAHHAGADPAAPRVLYYGHYDVQPPDPVDEWRSPPFEPTVETGPHGDRLVARGAVDDKGQLMTFVEALRAWCAVHGAPPVPVTVLLEGEEECGGPNLGAFLAANREALAADVCVISDTGAWDVDTPALTTQLRGLLYTELTVHGPGRDLHSGVYGGAVPNPLNVLGRVIAGLHDSGGSVAVPGFYDAVVEPDAATLARWRELDVDERAFLDEVGVDAAGGERGRGLLEKLWSRPTCDVNGMIGGYTGPGAKTVLPASASAKISFRLVPDQDPDAVADAVRAHLGALIPAGCTWSLTVHHGAPPIRVRGDSPYLAAARDALAAAYGTAPVDVGCGGTIPVVGEVKRELGLDSLLMGFGLSDDGMHGPNEKFELRCFARGAHAHAALLERLARRAEAG